MATGQEFKQIAEGRIRSTKILLDNNDWHFASYVMGYALECALKAVICKTLGISEYPEVHKDRSIPNFFKDHSFDRLHLLSGTSLNVFGPNGDPREFDNWSQFTARYPGDWITMRYAEASKQFDEVTSKSLYKCLFEDEHSIIKTISDKNLW